MPLPQDFLDELHSRNDISEVIGSYISLIGRGRTSKALCPFHSEKTPSFTVFGDTQSFFCFGCNTGGDVISFVMKLDNLSYIEAVRKLADRVNLKMPEDVNDDNAKLRMRIYAANKKAARFFFDHLNSDDGRNARSYLRQRGLQDNFIAKFGLGFSPTGWSDLRDFLRKEGFYDRELLAAGLIAEGKSGTYDVFRSRIMIPIIDIRGNVIAFGGRALGDTGPKYINTSDTPVFKKSRNLFALNIAKGLSRELILAEGYMDVIMLHQAGFTGSVATLGTALTVEQTRLISQYADEVLICYDSDEAGKRATKRAIDLCRQIGLSVRVVDYTGAKDPDEYIRKFGSKAFNELLIKSKNSLEYELNKAKDKYPISTDEGKVRYLSEASMILAGSTSPTEIDIYASKLSNEFSVGKEAIMAQVSDIRKRRHRNNSKKFLESL
ncbi:MAG: DNA primase, partial [Oscillospiraceae bacterium]|nr:DNA primase [Oscillospiraceae bacterium]